MRTIFYVSMCISSQAGIYTKSTSISGHKHVWNKWGILFEVLINLRKYLCETSVRSHTMMQTFNVEKLTFHLSLWQIQNILKSSQFSQTLILCIKVYTKPDGTL